MSNKKLLKLGLLNARSLNTGKDELLITILNYAPDILAINETWLKTGEEELAPVIPNYRFVHRARKCKRGGGVGFFVKQGITTRVRRHPASPLEQMWMEIQLPGATMSLGTTYRPESVGVIDALDALSESLNSMAPCDYTCILGDLNIDMTHSNSPRVRELKNFCHQNNLEQLVKEPTRITDRSETILDLIMTNSISKCRRVDIIHNHCLSDHALVLLDFDIKKPKLNAQVKIQRTLHNIDIDLFKHDLALIPWESIYALADVNEMVEAFNTYIMQLFDVHAPIRETVIKDRLKPWVTNMVKFMIKLRDNALAKALKDKKDTSRDYYRNLKNFVTATIEREKKAYFRHFINNNLNKPATLWKNIKNTVQIDNRRTNLIPEQFNDPEAINVHFLNLPSYNNTKNESSIIRSCKPLSDCCFELKPTTEIEIRKIINNIKTKAAGIDTINIDMIKLIMDVTLP